MLHIQLYDYYYILYVYAEYQRYHTTNVAFSIGLTKQNVYFLL